MTQILGIDPSSKKIAIVTTIDDAAIEAGFLSDGKPETRIINLPEGVYSATGAAFREVFAFLEENDYGGYFGKRIIYIEDPVVGRNVRSTIVQAQVSGAIIAAAECRGVPVFHANVNSWKKEVVGKGNATKPEVAEWLEKNWPEAYNLAAGDQDLIDAAAINRYGDQHVRLVKAIVKRKKNGNGKG
jgi:Crossover junction endodeoxyribonuclease RuvC